MLNVEKLGFLGFWTIRHHTLGIPFLVEVVKLAKPGSVRFLGACICIQIPHAKKNQ